MKEKEKSEEEEKRSWSSLNSYENGTFPWVRVFLHRLQSRLQTPYLRNRSTQEEMSTLWGTQVDYTARPRPAFHCLQYSKQWKAGWDLGPRLVFSYMYTRLFINACTIQQRWLSYF